MWIFKCKDCWINDYIKEWEKNIRCFWCWIREDLRLSAISQRNKAFENFKKGLPQWDTNLVFLLKNGTDQLI